MNSKIFLAAVSHVKSTVVPYYKPHYILESFMDIKNKTKKTEEYVRWCLTADMFLLDSGAFAFMNKAKSTQGVSGTELKKYIQDYVEFINRWDIKYFFELDLDCKFEYDKVKSIRKYIERNTGKKCIPVWHKSRGMDEFHAMCREYDYVAVGGIASKEINSKSDYGLLCELCDIAHSYNCKVHGLGFLSLEKLNNGKCPFDTVDGTGWQGHMRAIKFELNDGKIFRLKDEELKEKKRTWKDNETEGFGIWTEFSKIVEERND